MRIAHAAHSMFLGQIGLNQMVYQLEMGQDVVALCPDDEWAGVIKDRGIRVIDVPFLRHNLFATLMATARMWRICHRERFDVVHTHNSLPGVTGRIAGRLAGIPAVVHTCHAWPLHQPRGRIFHWLYKTFETLAARGADATLFQNTDDMRTCIALKVVPASKAVLIGNGIDTQQLSARASSDGFLRIREEFGIGSEAFLLVNVARLERPKGQAFLLQGLHRLVGRTDREVVALFVGTGKHEKEVRAEVKRLGLEPFVRFAGYRRDVPDILQAADVSVLTSLFEGIPRSLMESMALGLPVVATDVPGTRTLVESGRTGLLVEYGDVEGLVNAFTQLIDEPELRKRLGENGRRLVRTKFDERLVAERVQRVYERVLQGES